MAVDEKGNMFIPAYDSGAMCGEGGGVEGKGG